MADNMESDDPVVHEVDVYLSRSLASNLFVVQYPLHHKDTSFDNVHRSGAKVKPKQKMLEIQMAMNTECTNYSLKRGKRLAKDAEDEDSTGSTEPSFDSGIMDRQVLRSVPLPANIDRLSVAVLKGNELHMSPVNAVVQMQPVFDHVDMKDKKKAADAARREAGDSSQEEDELEAVTVRFARPETAEAKARRLISFEYVQQQVDNEQWCPTPFYSLADQYDVEKEFMMMYSTRGESKQQQFQSTSSQYLDVLLPKPDVSEDAKPSMPDNILTRQRLKQMPLADAVRALLVHVKVMQFSKVMEMLPEKTDPMAVLRVLQQVAMLVQGCWVVKSEVLYSTNNNSPHSALSVEHLIRGRDLVMWKFTHCKYVVRKEIACGLPSDDIKDILEQMSKLCSSKGWQFVFDYDRKFVERYPEIVMRQRVLWDAKYQTLCQHFKLPKDADKKAKEAEQVLMMQNADRPRRRRSSSRSSPRKRTLSGRSIPDVSDMEIDASGNRNSSFPLINPSQTTLEPVEVCGEEGLDLQYISKMAITAQNSVHESMDGARPEPDELKQELTEFVRRTLTKMPMVRLNDLIEALRMKQSELPKSHILMRKAVTVKMMEEAAVAAGAVHLKKPKDDPAAISLFLFVHQHDRMDKAREVLSSMFEVANKLKSANFISKVKETVGDEYTDSELRKLLKDFCENYNSMWYLKGTVFSS